MVAAFCVRPLKNHGGSQKRSHRCRLTVDKSNQHDKSFPSEMFFDKPFEIVCTPGKFFFSKPIFWCQNCLLSNLWDKSAPLLCWQRKERKYCATKNAGFFVVWRDGDVLGLVGDCHNESLHFACPLPTCLFFWGCSNSRFSLSFQSFLHLSYVLRATLRTP